MQYKSRQYYSEAFKIEAVRRSVETFKSQQSVADELSVHVNMLGRWRKIYLSKSYSKAMILKKTKPPEKSYKELQQENKRLKKQLERSQTEAAILKKAQEYFAELRRNDSGS